MTAEGVLNESWRQWLQQFADEGLGARLRAMELMRSLLIPVTVLLCIALYAPPALLYWTFRAFMFVWSPEIAPSDVIFDRLTRFSHFICVFLLSALYVAKRSVDGVRVMYTKHRDAQYLVGVQLQNMERSSM